MPMDKSQIAEAGVALLTAQYTALRSEITQRIQLQHNIMAFTLTFVATFLGLAVQFEITRPVLLLYPFLALFLAAGWTHNDNRVHALGYYIRMHIERPLLVTFVTTDENTGASNQQSAGDVTTGMVAKFGWESFFCFYKANKGLPLRRAASVLKKSLPLRKPASGRTRTSEGDLPIFSDRFLNDWYAKPLFIVTQVASMLLAFFSINNSLQQYLPLFIMNGIIVLATFFTVVFPRTLGSEIDISDVRDDNTLLPSG